MIGLVDSTAGLRQGTSDQLRQELECFFPTMFGSVGPSTVGSFAVSY